MIKAQGNGGAPGTRPSGDRLRLLDSLRIVAALLVVLYHFTAVRTHAWGGPVGEVFPTLFRGTAYGALGVQLFFVISGFVILRSAWGVPVHRFVASRIGRLFPAYWFCVPLTGAVLLLAWNEDRHTTWHDVLVNLTMTQGSVGVDDVEGVYWTLWSELRFYLLVAVFTLVGITTKRVLAFCFLWPLLGAVANSAGSTLLVVLLNPGYAPLFAGGMALFVIYREGHSPLAWLLVAFNVIMSCQQTADSLLPVMSDSTGRHLRVAVVWALVVLSFAAVAVATLTRARELQWRWLTTAGALTYPLYLCHESLGKWLIHLLHPVVGAHVLLALVIAVCLGLAWLIHRYVEEPLGPRVRLLVLRSLEDRTGGPREDAAATPRAAGSLPAARKLRLAAEPPAGEPGRVADVVPRAHFPVPAGPLPVIPTQHSG